MEQRDLYHIFVILISILIIICDEYIYHNINNILKEQDHDKSQELCTCSQTEYLPRILKLIRFMLICDVIILISSILLYERIRLPYYYEISIALIALITFGVQIYYLYLLLQYLSHIKITSCNCINPSFKTMLNVYTFIAIFILAFDLVLSYFIDVHIINKLNIIPFIVNTVNTIKHTYPL